MIFSSARLPVLRLVTLLLLLVPLFVSGAAPSHGKPRLLLIGIDAIPYDVVRQLMDSKSGEPNPFPEMAPPAALINSFPTTSYTAWTALLSPLGIADTRGYESRYYDRTRGEIDAGFDLTDPPAPWKDFFDYRLAGIVPTAIAYGWPRYYSLKELDDGFRQFRESQDDVFTMYVISTDAVGHLYGPAAQAEFMRALDQRLRVLRARQRDRPFHVIMFSDHGMGGGNELVNTWPAIKQRMTAAGYRLQDRLVKKGDVVFIPYGLLSSFVIYTHDGDTTSVAETVSRVDGVDLCVSRDNDAFHIVSNRGNARVAYRQHEGQAQWTYRPESGDPLHYAEILAGLRQASSAPDALWFNDNDWFAATADHFYPDALYRLAHAFDFVQNPGSIVCSLKPGYMYGGLLTEYVAIPTIGPLRWTHGALDRGASLGFLMTDLPGWPARRALRFDQALLPLREMLAGRGHGHGPDPRMKRVN